MGGSENAQFEERGGHVQFSRTGESASCVDLKQEAEYCQVNHDLAARCWTRFLALMVIVNLVFTIICIAIFTQLRSEVMLLKQDKTSPNPLKAEALTDRNSSEFIEKPATVKSVTSINCELCRQGSKGETGDPGVRGAIGPKGQKGECGVQGVNGTKGEMGSPGMRGMPGMPGNQGARTVGIPGVQGPPGNPGQQGDRGPPGYNGSNGLNGEVGPRGPPGLKGSKGDAGEPGDAGPTGEHGSPGISGIAGAKGDKGDTGSSGLDGRDGTNGQRGDKGKAGEKGNTGSTGRNGTAGEPGSKGAKGEPGEIPDITDLRETIGQLKRQIHTSKRIRLVNSLGHLDRGRVEILHNGAWGTICDDSWDSHEGAVVCRMLGYAGVTSVSGSAAHGQGSGQIWLDQVDCAGSETHIERCSKNTWGTHDCSHGEDASVRCHD